MSDELATIYPVILSGGSGSRLWPISRAMHPKQFLPLHSEIAMLAETANRFQREGFAPPSVICNQDHRFMVAQCLADQSIQTDDIILEPVGRNTAPAIAVAALNVMKKDPDALILVLPSDHIIANTDAFIEAVKQVRSVASDGQLITFGIEPEYPETGYGYIQGGSLISGSQYVKKVQAFYEKPDQKTAQKYINSGGFFWNSGMFLFSVKTLINELEHVQPEIIKLSRQSLDQAQVDLDFLRLDQEAFSNMASISIDYALMDKTQNVAVMPVNIGWSDLGSWSSLWDVLNKDEAGNATKGDVILEDVSNSLIHSDSGSLAAVIGLEDVVVVHNDNVLLVADKKRSQDVKRIVERLKDAGREEVKLH